MHISANPDHVMIPILVSISLVPMIVLFLICVIRYKNETRRKRSKLLSTVEAKQPVRIVRFTEFSLYTVDEEGRVQSSPDQMKSTPFPPSHPFISSVETQPENDLEISEHLLPESSNIQNPENSWRCKHHQKPKSKHSKCVQTSPKETQRMPCIDPAPKQTLRFILRR
ncbi:uncharacterized protein LOC111695589 isoform X2 [Eurytemora carolleeae]|uniref:uncharacterized protein LOC111695589 isoform X2 n=1 Tax=Eurytemora carolleeae TaxID=1294199 RepID=UPI000C78CF8F|nr:uncharacterized protein LOC111695589 isoform X2 [Eurytemora carolleeae]|eukprot:XP_023320745.1 uncharacterized protein LOC111695589 isoform X2 [Eurytemora affinis]